MFPLPRVFLISLLIPDFRNAVSHPPEILLRKININTHTSQVNPNNKIPAPSPRIHTLAFPGTMISIPLSTKDRKWLSLKVSSTAAFALKKQAAITAS